jgi:hypothetical protein
MLTLYAPTLPHSIPSQELVDLPLPPPHNYTLEHATREAVGVEMNRLQNIVITLDKVGWGCTAGRPCGGGLCAIGIRVCWVCLCSTGA